MNYYSIFGFGVLLGLCLGAIFTGAMSEYAEYKRSHSGDDMGERIRRMREDFDKTKRYMLTL